MCLLVEDLFLVVMWICIKGKTSPNINKWSWGQRTRQDMAEFRVIENADIAWVSLQLSGQGTHIVYSFIKCAFRNLPACYHQKENPKFTGWQRECLEIFLILISYLIQISSYFFFIWTQLYAEVNFMFWHNLFLVFCFVLFLIKKDNITFSREKVATNLYNYIYFFT